VSIHLSRDLPVTVGLTALCAALVLAPVPVAARAPAGLLLALVLPGYGLSRLLLGRSSPGRAQLAASVLALSLAAAALGGLLLNLAPGHLGRPAWVAFLAALTVGCCVAAGLAGRPGAGPAGRPGAGLAAPRWRPAIGRHVPALLLGTAAVKPLPGRRVQVGVSPGPGPSTGLALVVRDGQAPSRLPVPSLAASRSYTRTLTVPAGASSVLVQLDQGTRVVRHVQYQYAAAGSGR
jgi:hypothetical protein